MVRFTNILLVTSIFFMLPGCKKEVVPGDDPPVIPPVFSYRNLTVDNQPGVFTYSDIGINPKVRVSFNAPVDQSSITAGVVFRSKAGESVAFKSTLENGDSVLTIQPISPLAYLTSYIVGFNASLKSRQLAPLSSTLEASLRTRLDSSDKFPRIADDALLTLIQKQTFAYFWDFAHPVSGMARERTTSGDVVTTGGTGFGVMAIPVAIERGFIPRASGLARLVQIVDFLDTKVTKYHGAVPHWLNGNTGATVPFSTKDNGGDLVETSLLFQGLLTARQYFSGSSAAEVALREKITRLYNAVEWSWYTKSGTEKVLYWHWSPNYNWEMNLPIRGWNESLITYVLAASSTQYAIGKEVYDQGWAGSGAFKNAGNYLGIQIPLGSSTGGPLFFSHYSFLGLDPRGLVDSYADYLKQVQNHSKVNQAYCVQNPNGHVGYSEACWGLTASDDNKTGYSAHAPGNDPGVISPTAAVSSLPWVPEESMAAIRFFYYVLGDKLWGEYGFKDAFNLNDNWYANSYLAIDQGPMIVMIENYRSGLLWNLFMSAPEVQKGLKKLAFASPKIQ